MHTEADLSDLLELLKHPLLDAIAFEKVDVSAQVEDHRDPVGQAALGQLDRQREDAEHAVAIEVTAAVHPGRQVGRQLQPLQIAQQGTRALVP